MCQFEEQGLFSLDSLLMDCINLKFVRWLRFNSSASYWLVIFLSNQSVDLKSPFLSPLLKYPTISIYLPMLVNKLFFYCVVIPFDGTWKITGFRTNKYCCVCIKMNISTAIWHFLENTDFCEWWQVSVLKQVVCDWSWTENSCSEKMCISSEEHCVKEHFF